MTSIKIVPSIEKKTARVTGCVAAGEHVDVRIVGGASLLPSTTLRLRVKFGPSTIAVFPRADKDDAWGRDGEDLTCHLSLDTVPAKKICICGDTVCALILDQVGDKDHLEEPTLFFESAFTVRAWHQEPGADEPYDLERYPDQIRELERKIEESAETVEAAKTAVLDAKGAANDAKEAAQSALGSAQNANAQAGIASAAAQNAAESAERAERSLSQINSQVEEARNAALASEGAATTAAVEAGKAAERAEEAKAAATEAVAAAQGAVNAIDAHKKDFDNPHKVTKSQLGLGNVDDTADMNKPVSHRQREALDLKQDKLSDAQLSKIANALTDASKFDKAGDAAKVKADLLIEIGKLGHIEIRRVTTRPQTGESGVLYLVPSATSEQENIYDEYLWIDGAWEMIGSTAVDLSGYVKNDADYATVSENAATGAGHAADATPHVTEAQKAAWDAKQNALTTAQLANIAAIADKRDKSDLDVYEMIRTENTDWTWSFSPSVKELEDAYKGKKPTYEYGNVWFIDWIEVGAFTPNSSIANAGRDATALEGFNFIDTISGDLINLTITRPRYMDETLGPAKANEKLASRDTTAAQGALAKFGDGGKLVAATEQDVPHDSTKRDKTDNICALDEYAEWVFTGMAEGDSSLYTASFVEDPQMWAIKKDGVVIFWKMDANEDDVEIRGPYEDADGEEVISPLRATRHIFAKSTESYVTKTGVENLPAGGLTPEAMTAVFATPAFKTGVATALDEQGAKDKITTLAEAAITDKVDPRLEALETAITGVAADLAEAIGEEA